MDLRNEKTNFLTAEIGKSTIILAVVLTFVYFYLISFRFEIGNIVLFIFLIIGEIFHVFQVIMYHTTVWEMNYEAPKDDRFKEPVDVFITVAGEPTNIVEE